MSNPNFICRIDFTSPPFASTPAWTDVSADLQAFSIRRGRVYELARMQAGQATIQLNNISGNYWSTNTSGPYYGNIDVDKRVNIRVGGNVLINPNFELGGTIDVNPPSSWTLVGAGASVVRSSAHPKIDSSSAFLARSGADCYIYQSYAGYAQYANKTVTLGMWVYCTIANRAQISISDGVTGTFSAYHSGSGTWEWITATKTMDNAASEMTAFAWVKNADTGAWFDGAVFRLGSSIVAPLVDWELNTYDLYTGFISSWEPGFILPPIKAPYVIIKATDLFENLNRLPVSGYSSELSGTRITNVLNTMKWPSTDRLIATGQSTMQAGPTTTQLALSHIYNVNDSELGLFYIGANGYTVFQDRLTRSTATSAALFGDLPSTSKYFTPTIAIDKFFLYNDIQETRNGGAMQQATSTTSQDTHGDRALIKTGLIMTTDADALDQCYYQLRNYQSTAPRLKSILIKPNGDPAGLYPKVLGYDLSTRISYELTQASLAFDYFIEGINHDWKAVDPVGLQTSWQLSNASVVAYPTRETLNVVPNGAGDSTTIQHYTAATHWQSQLSGGDSVYQVSGSGVDLYAMGDISSASPVISLTVKCTIGLDIPSTNNYDLSIKINGATHSLGASTISTGSHAATYTLTGSYTQAQVNAMQAGVTLAVISVGDSQTISAQLLSVDVVHYANW